MEASELIVWALCIGIALNLLFSITGLDDLISNLFGKSKTNDLELKVEELEARIKQLESNSK